MIGPVGEPSVVDGFGDVDDGIDAQQAEPAEQAGVDGEVDGVHAATTVDRLGRPLRPADERPSGSEHHRAQPLGSSVSVAGRPPTYPL